MMMPEIIASQFPRLVQFPRISAKVATRAGYVHICTYERYKANLSTPVDETSSKGSAKIAPSDPAVTCAFPHPAAAIRFRLYKKRTAGKALKRTWRNAPFDSKLFST